MVFNEFDNLRLGRWIISLLIVIFLIGLISEQCFSSRLSYLGLERNYVQLIERKPRYFIICGKLNYLRDYYVGEDKLGLERDR